MNANSACSACIPRRDGRTVPAVLHTCAINPEPDTWRRDFATLVLTEGQPFERPALPHEREIAHGVTTAILEPTPDGGITRTLVDDDDDGRVIGLSSTIDGHAARGLA
ncbi:hypothetical protein AB0C38_31775 [Amycolatopsis sp. NPDC048633]|uniref:hypothetical protein n=1 Tax=Amycolatopsis sp. NPDC048633 TaxID=3157095 RepID=UPI0033C166A4